MKKELISGIISEWKSIEKIQLPEPGLPKTLMIEVTNACNLKCIMCQQSKMKRKKGFIQHELLMNILPEAKACGIQKIALYTTGEPLLHPDFINIIKMCKDFGFYCYTTTNGMLLDEKKCKELSQSGLDSIKISIDGSSKKEYEKIRIGGNFTQLIRNIKMLRQYRDKHNKNMTIYAGAVVMNINENSLKAFKRLFSPHVDSIYFSPLVNQSGQLYDKYEALKPTQLSSDSRWKPCRMLWDRIVLSFDGQLTACCVDYEMELAYSRYPAKKLHQAWNCKKMKSLRKAHLDSNVSHIPLCRTCNAPYIQQIEVIGSLNKLR